MKHHCLQQSIIPNPEIYCPISSLGCSDQCIPCRQWFKVHTGTMLCHSRSLQGTDVLTAVVQTQKSAYWTRCAAFVHCCRHCEASIQLTTIDRCKNWPGWLNHSMHAFRHSARRYSQWFIGSQQFVAVLTAVMHCPGTSLGYIAYCKACMHWCRVNAGAANCRPTSMQAPRPSDLTSVMLWQNQLTGCFCLCSACMHCCKLHAHIVNCQFGQYRLHMCWLQASCMLTACSYVLLSCINPDWASRLYWWCTACIHDCKLHSAVFRSLQATCDVLARTSHNLIKVHHALLQKAFKQCDLPTSLQQSTGPGEVTAVPH